MTTIKCWIEAMRLRTLPVSVAGVITAVAFNLMHGNFNAAPAFLCLVFAVLAQIASNFANEYYDYAAGLDRAGREGPRRGVTEGDISPRAMLVATFATLAMACVVGCSLIAWGGWWLIAAGVAIAIGVLAYSAGPYPLSHHALGEVAVVCFFGIIPVNLTYYVQCLQFSSDVMMASVAVGLMGANVLIVNNYRDLNDDKSVGKTTLAVLFGRQPMRFLYAADAIAAVVIMLPAWLETPWPFMLAPLFYVVGAAAVVARMGRLDGRALNPLLGITAIMMLVYALAFLIAAICS